MQPISQTDTLKLSDDLTPDGGRVVIRSGSKKRTIVAPTIMRRENIQCLIFPKVDVGVGMAPPGAWFISDSDIVMVCPRCGTRHLVLIERDAYKIDARGLLYPSVLCPNDKCDFDRYCLLQGWRGMGKLGRKKDNERGIILYCLAWQKWMRGPTGVWSWYLQPFEYCHAVDLRAAQITWEAFIQHEKGRVVGIAPSLDPHVSGDGDPAHSILGL
jgi:hypothetical protein